jgi:hypothetical protein
MDPSNRGGCASELGSFPWYLNFASGRQIFERSENDFYFVGKTFVFRPVSNSAFSRCNWQVYNNMSTALLTTRSTDINRAGLLEAPGPPGVVPGVTGAVPI